jgi:flavin reductase (DIM6/NTAB) family NADH-FMN oxidoreductase RutF
MFYETAANRHGLRHDPFKALVAPRPIGWISSLNRQGQVNLAPYSYFNAVSNDPHVVVFGSQGRKDSQRNIEETGEFVCNLATWGLREAMNQTSAMVASEVDEMALAGLEPAPSRMVGPPRVAVSPVALECRYMQTVRLPVKPGFGENSVIFGEVVGIHIADEAIEDGMIDITRLRTIARCGYHDYAVVDSVFAMIRPTV